ncbi:Phosphate-selective porin O and P [Novipirellula aureliae]|uniref:Phosphate-selective porin O and P n=1 Tax=Novipirellula aureliae TaxID=2527966 RepID=A0A5C6DH56_9BACT|nr:porin [Novipirellula aureliae]TWU36653.1 Phosphate-selective porin O and P [Novipirellula aureliae]
MTTRLPSMCGGLLVVLCIAVATFFSANQAFADEMNFGSVHPVAYNMLELGIPTEEIGDAANATVDPSDTDEAEDKLAELSKKIAAFEEELEMLGGAIDDVSDLATDKTIVHSGTSKSTMKVGGRIHLDAWGFDPKEENPPNFMDDGDPENRLGFRRVRFGVKGNIKDNMLYKVEMEFAGGNKSEFRDVYMGWVDLPVFQTVLAGNQKRPYGLDHLNSSRFNVFLERPFVIEGFNQDARRLGVASYGFSDDLRYNWRYGVYNQQKIQGLGNYVGDHLQLELAGRLASTVWYDEISGGRGYAHLAISGTHADNPGNGIADDSDAEFKTRPEARSSDSTWLDADIRSNTDSYDLMGLESVINVGALQIVGEYQRVWADRQNGAADTEFDGGYVYASYFLTGEHMPWDRESGTLARIKPFQNFWIVDRCDDGTEAGWGAWQIALRYSRADFVDQDIFGGEGEAWTYGLNWYWNPNARMQFNYISGNISNRDSGPGGALQSGDYDIYGVRFGVDF